MPSPPGIPTRWRRTASRGDRGHRPVGVIAGPDWVRELFAGPVRRHAGPRDHGPQRHRGLRAPAAVEWRAVGTFTGAPFQGIAATGSGSNCAAPTCWRSRRTTSLENTAYYDGAAFAPGSGCCPRGLRPRARDAVQRVQQGQAASTACEASAMIVLVTFTVGLVSGSPRGRFGLKAFDAFLLHRRSPDDGRGARPPVQEIMNPYP